MVDTKFKLSVYLKGIESDVDLGIYLTSLSSTIYGSVVVQFRVSFLNFLLLFCSVLL